MKKTIYEQVLDILRKLKAKYPHQGLGKHLSEALMDYPNFWGISDKEFLFALEKYVYELEENSPLPEDELKALVESSSSIDRLREGIDEYEEDSEDGDEEE